MRDDARSFGGSHRPGYVNLMDQIIATETLYAQRPGEAAFELCIQIGTPYPVGDDPE